MPICKQCDDKKLIKCDECKNFSCKKHIRNNIYKSFCAKYYLCCDCREKKLIEYSLSHFHNNTRLNENPCIYCKNEFYISCNNNNCEYCKNKYCTEHT